MGWPTKFTLYKLKNENGFTHSYQNKIGYRTAKVVGSRFIRFDCRFERFGRKSTFLFFPILLTFTFYLFCKARGIFYSSPSTSSLPSPTFSPLPTLSRPPPLPACRRHPLATSSPPPPACHLHVKILERYEGRIVNMRVKSYFILLEKKTHPQVIAKNFTLYPNVCIKIEFLP